jgi:hypothetical protein
VKQIPDEVMAFFALAEKVIIIGFAPEVPGALATMSPGVTRGDVEIAITALQNLPDEVLLAIQETQGNG